MEKNLIRLPKNNFVSQVVQLPYDLVYKILLLLPGKSLIRLRFVCKEWFNIINCTTFIEAHIHHQSETGLVFLRTISMKRSNTFSIEAGLVLPDESEQFSMFTSSSSNKYSSCIHFMQLQDGKGVISEPNISCPGDILATCNGLILSIIPKNRGLVVINPIIRKLIRLPLGTIVDSRVESYGFMFTRYTSEYKVAHLYWEKSGYVGCEILSLTTRSWHAVDGPSFGLIKKFVHRPVSVGGALYWLPRKHGCGYVVSISFHDKKFRTRTLPISCTENDRIVEFCGSLSFVTHVTLNRIQVWILKGGLPEENWTKQYTINTDHNITYLVPILTSRNGREMIFSAYRGSLHAYDFEVELMKKVEVETEDFEPGLRYLPHVNSLASWKCLPAL